MSAAAQESTHRIVLSAERVESRWRLCATSGTSWTALYKLVDDLHLSTQRDLAQALARRLRLYGRWAVCATDELGLATWSLTKAPGDAEFTVAARSQASVLAQELRRLGFDKTRVVSAAYGGRAVVVGCTRCSVVVINSRPAHEKGCPNAKSKLRRQGASEAR